jgi:hypothetical protein
MIQIQWHVTNILSKQQENSGSAKEQIFLILMPFHIKGGDFLSLNFRAG